MNVKVEAVPEAVWNCEESIDLFILIVTRPSSTKAGNFCGD
jgi:hypothetical protein